MTLLAFITVLLVVRSATSCDTLEDNVEGITPWQRTYSEDDVATMTCLDNYIISWASSVADSSASIKCGSSDWVPEPAVDSFTGTVECVACIKDTVDCTDGTCTDGACVCTDGYEMSLENPRLCTIVQCDALTLSNQAADSPGPYDVDTVVTVTCTAGFHVEGDDSVVEQILTCDSEGIFDKNPKPCVVCADGDDCTDGTCNANNVCECDEASGYRLNNANLHLCEEVTCPDDYCSNNGECSVKGIELECDCKTGTAGDTCADFTTDPCGKNPCENEGTCNRDMSDPSDYTKYTCSCTDGFTGESCGEVVEVQDEKEEDTENTGPSDNEDENESENEDETEDDGDGEENSAGCTYLGNIIGLLVATGMVFF